MTSSEKSYILDAALPSFAKMVLGTHSGLVILVRVAVCFLGIVFEGVAGVSKERSINANDR